MNNLEIIMWTASATLALHLWILFKMLFQKPTYRHKKTPYDIQMVYICGFCGSLVETKFNNKTDRELEHTFCPCCGDPERI